MKTVLISGGIGFIGSHTVVELLLFGYKVIVVDDLSNSNLKISEGIKKITKRTFVFHKINICDLKQLEKEIFSKYPIDGIIHFAAKKAVGESTQKPLLYYSNNLNGLLNLLTLSKKYKINNFVFSSSCTVYGQPDTLPIKEDAIFQKAKSPYGNTKQICEEILEDFTNSNKNFKNISLRYFNPIGAHPTALIGELPLEKPNNLIPYLTQTAIGWREKLYIFGGDYNTVDGTAIRDYIHVVDLAKAHIIALERLLLFKHLKNYEYFNLGTGKGYSVLEIIKNFEAISTIKVNYEIIERRSGDIEKIFSDTTLSKKILGWKTKYDLNTMLKSAWNWQKYLDKQGWNYKKVTNHK